MGRRQLPGKLTTDDIEDAALSMGAKLETVWQWRRRGVPLAWRIKITQANKKIGFSDFPEKPKGRKNG